MTPIGQQNMPGPLKMLGLHEKTGQYTEFDLPKICQQSLDAAFTPV
jgi:hypothetical protein